MVSILLLVLVYGSSWIAADQVISTSRIFESDSIPMVGSRMEMPMEVYNLLKPSAKQLICASEEIESLNKFIDQLVSGNAPTVLDLAGAAVGLQSLQTIGQQLPPGVFFGFMGVNSHTNSMASLAHQIVLLYHRDLAENRDASYSYGSNAAAPAADPFAPLKSVLNSSHETFMIDLFRFGAMPAYQQFRKADEDVSFLSQFFHLIMSGMLPSVQQFNNAAASLKSLKNVVDQLPPGVLCGIMGSKIKSVYPLVFPLVPLYYGYIPDIDPTIQFGIVSSIVYYVRNNLNSYDSARSWRTEPHFDVNCDTSV